MCSINLILHKLHQTRELINQGTGKTGVYLSHRECESIVMLLDQIVKLLAKEDEHE